MYGVNSKIISLGIFNAQVANGGTTVSTIFDTIGMRGSLLITINCRAGGSGSVTPVVQHSFTTTAGDFVDLPLSEILDRAGLPAPFATLTTAASTVTRYIAADRILRRYLRVNFPDATFNQNVAVAVYAYDPDTTS